MDGDHMEWDATTRTLTVTPSRAARALSTAVVLGVAAVCVLLSAVLTVGAIVLEGRFTPVTLLPLLGLLVVARIRNHIRRADEATRVRFSPLGIDWHSGRSGAGGEVPWAEIAELRRLRYHTVTGRGAIGGGGRALTHAVEIVRHDGSEEVLPTVPDRHRYVRVLAAVQDRGLVPSGIRLAGLAPGDVPSDIRPPTAAERPR